MRKIDLHTIHSNGHNGWFDLFTKVVKEVYPIDFSTVIKFPNTIQLWEKGAPPTIHRISPEMTVGEIAFNALIEIKDAIPNESDLDQYYKMESCCRNTLYIVSSLPIELKL